MSTRTRIPRGSTLVLTVSSCQVGNTTVLIFAVVGVMYSWLAQEALSRRCGVMTTEYHQLSCFYRKPTQEATYPHFDNEDR